jgi:hypothetical protein
VAATGSPGATRTPAIAKPPHADRPVPASEPGGAVDGVRHGHQHPEHQQDRQRRDRVGVGGAHRIAQERHPGADVDRVAEWVEEPGERHRDAEVQQLEQRQDAQHQPGRTRDPGSRSGRQQHHEREQQDAFERDPGERGRGERPDLLGD